MNEGRAPAKAPDVHRGLLAAAVAAVLVLIACGASAPATQSPPTAQSVPTATDSSAPPGTIPHGDHNPHHGGVVLMKGDLHYEVVLDATGHEYRVYFSDAMREDLPASFASSVSLTIHRPSEADEAIPLQIDVDGESWIGSGRVVRDPAKTSARVAFTVAHEPYWIDVEFGGTAAGTKN
jgi:hypothetical protein